MQDFSLIWPTLGKAGEPSVWTMDEWCIYQNTIKIHKIRDTELSNWATVSIE